MLGRVWLVHDTPQRPEAPPGSFVLLIGLHNRKITGDECEKITRRPISGAEFSGELRAEVVRKTVVLDMTVKRE